VKAIINAEVDSFSRWLHDRQIVPAIADLRSKALALANAELAQALRRLQGLDPRGQQAITRLTHRLVNKLLHESTICLKLLSANDSGQGGVQAMENSLALEVTAESPPPVLPHLGGVSDA
jgi:glutamyl-tRNA reductase